MFLFCWHVAHPATYFVIQVRIPGHQYERETWVKVSSLPGCPAVGASWSSWRISRLSVSSGGITKRPSFTHSSSSLTECVGFHSSMVARCCLCASWIFACNGRVIVGMVLMVGNLPWHCSQLFTYFVTHSSASGHQ